MSDKSSFEAHFPQKISKSLVRFVTDTVLKESRYLFFKTVLGLQYAYCTHCNKRHRSEVKLKHKQEEKVRCVHCKSMCFVRAAGVSRKYMEDKAVFVWYEKSVINPKAITARIISVRRYYGERYENVETKYNCSNMYLFEPGRSEYRDLTGKRKSVFSAFDQRYANYDKFVSFVNILKAVKGTPFQYCTWEQYTKYRNRYYVSDMVEFFDLAARYPCVEYLTKLGFKQLIWNKLYREVSFGAVNWRGKTPEKVLRLNKFEINEIRKSGLDWSPSHLSYFQKQLKAGNKISAEDAYVLSQIDNGYYASYLKEAEKYTSRQVALTFLLKQYRRGGTRSDIQLILIDWKDYMKQCKELGMSLNEERYLFPNDLHAAHQKLTKQIKLKENKALDKLLQERMPALQKFAYESSDYIIRPIATVNELFQEGKALNHCVGSYAESYAKGNTDLFAIRKKSNPGKPFFTLQISSGKLNQCRGLKNCDMTDEIRAFVNQFIQRKLLTKKRTRIDVTGISQQNRQEAVV